MLTAAFSLAFFGFLRCGEFTIVNQKHENILRIADIKMDADRNGFTLTLRSSKTDPFRKGINIRVFKSNKSVCPVRAMCEYLEMRQKVKYGDELSALFIDHLGKPLSRTVFLGKLKDLLDTMGLCDGNFNGHSFRIGAATSAERGQVPDHMIKTLGRWSSDCYTRYVRTDDTTLSRAQNAMCK
jgi:hypothetical protein